MERAAGPVCMVGDSVFGLTKCPVPAARRRLGPPTSPQDAVVVRHDSSAQRHTFTRIQRQECGSAGTGHSGGQFGGPLLVGDGTVDEAVVVLPYAFDKAVSGQGSQDGADIGGQRWPDSETGPGSQCDANRVDGVAREVVPS